VGFAERISDTNDAIILYVNKAGIDLTKLGLRRAAKSIKDTYRKVTVPAKVNTIFAAVVGKYGVGSPQELEVFPQGRTYYREGADDQLAQKLNALKDAVDAKAADLGAPIVTAAADLVTNWATIYTSSEEKSGGKTVTESDKRTARENLQLELYFNLIELMKKFPRQPEKLALYMTQSLLEDDESEPEEPTP
jgi:hypothetical protein